MSNGPSRQPAVGPMHDQFSKLGRRDTKPELALRRALFAAGYRYRVEVAVPGLPRRRVDIAFPREKLAVMVDGCFWHGCPDHRKPPSRNSEWWEWKRATNEARDRDTDAKLAALGWKVLRIWEHEGPDEGVARVAGALQALR